MKFKINKTVGKLVIQFEDEASNHLEFFKSCEFYSKLPSHCGNPKCGSSNIAFQYREPKGFSYATIECGDCKFRLSYGQYKEGKGKLFPKEWNVYSAEDETGEELQ